LLRALGSKTPERRGSGHATRQTANEAKLAGFPGPGGLVRIWLDPKFVDRLGHMRRLGESYSDVILRLAEASS
jgi:hypothetical protein